MLTSRYFNLVNIFCHNKVRSLKLKLVSLKVNKLMNNKHVNHVNVFHLANMQTIIEGCFIIKQ